MALSAVTFVAFLPALQGGFVNYDDPGYVTENQYVLSGLSVEGVRWAFASFDQANWHPLTWLSLELDGTLWNGSEGGPNPLGFHLTSVLLHSVNAALVFLALRKLTGAYRRSLMVAILFAVHPLRVESVAWVSERKDVLSTLFGLLCLWAYGWYAEAPSRQRNLLVQATFALSLMAKSMMVTLPFLFLVLDGWPLGRRRDHNGWRLVREKLPLFALSAAICIVTLFAQSIGGTVADQQSIPFHARIANAVFSYGIYLWKTAWPANLAALYPHAVLNSGGVDTTSLIAAALVVVTLSAIAVVLRKKAPFLLTGWLWYLGTLVPVIGIVQVGIQGYADRYMYFPQIGILIGICWGVAELAGAIPRVAMAAGMTAAVVLAVVTWRQISTWHDPLSLWGQVLASGGVFPVALNNYGEALGSLGEDTKAVEYFRRALAGNSDLPVAHLNLGIAMQKLGNFGDAEKHLEDACKLDPKSTRARIHLADILYQEHRFPEAEKRYKEALEITPNSASIRCRLGDSELAMNRPDLAESAFRTVLQTKPHLAAAHIGLGRTLARRNRLAEASAELHEAIRCDPRSGGAWNDLGEVLERTGDLQAAATNYEMATGLNPETTLYWFNLGRIRGKQGKPAEAVDCFEKAEHLDPHAPPELRTAMAYALDDLAALHFSSGRLQEAVATARRAREKAATVDRPDLVQLIETHLDRYEKKDSPPAATRP